MLNIYMIILYLFIMFLFFVFYKKNDEPFQIFMKMSPPKRNISLDLRCEPQIPKKKYGFYNSTIDYYERPKCLISQ